ncbi:MAG: hypothetical protein IKN04_07995 [Clostridia bacterium]|nr:hypothetical protein [Clostridia bacterium]
MGSMKTEDYWIKTDDDLFFAMQMLKLIYNKEQIEDLTKRIKECIDGKKDVLGSIKLGMDLLWHISSVRASDLDELTKERVLYTLQKAWHRVAESFSNQIKVRSNE